MFEVLRKAKNHAGKDINVYGVNQADYMECDDSSIGICLNCGEPCEGCEPDARKYHCDACGQDKVYGVPEALMMGRLDITDSDDLDFEAVS